MRSPSARRVFRGLGVALLTASLGACGVTDDRPRPVDFGIDVVFPDIVTVDNGARDTLDVPADAACPSTWARCVDMTCYAILSDPTHCGSCSVACAAGQRCNAGECESGDGGADVPAATDTGADVPAAIDLGAPVDVPAAIDLGAPVDVPVICPSSQVNCSGMCRSLTMDVDNCGGCGVRCAAGQACTASACQTVPPVDSGTLVCPGGQIDCGGYCADTSRDPFNCGGCGVRCATGQVCTARVCTSGGGGMDAGPGGGDGGVIPQDSGPCAAGTVSCGGYCANTSSDPFNCGGCGVRCANNQVCTARVCTAGGTGGGDGGPPGEGGMGTLDSGPCAAGTISCGGYCASTSNDPLNCGGCGVRCTSPQPCNGGVCSAPSTDGGTGGMGDGGGSVMCGNPTRPCCTTSPACISGGTCVSGTCVADCGMSGQTCCAGARQCQPGLTCTSGVCR